MIASVASKIVPSLGDSSAGALAFKVTSPSALASPPAAALGDSGELGASLHAMASASIAAKELATKIWDRTMNFILLL